MSEIELSDVVRRRLRQLRRDRGWSLDALATRSHLSPSTLSRIETGRRRIDLDQLAALAGALGTTSDHLVEPSSDALRPARHQEAGLTTWILSGEPGRPGGRLVAKMRITAERRTGPGHLAVHPGREWFTVVSGVALLHLGVRRIVVGPGEKAEFETTTPHSVGALRDSVEIITVHVA